MKALADYFDGVVAKRLSAVEADPGKSNQHEFNGIKGLMELFGRRRYGKKAFLECTFLYLDDEYEACEAVQDEITWYESRQSPRSEHRLYYKTSAVTEKFEEGDLVVFLKRKDSKVLVVFARKESAAEQQLLWLFSLSPENLQKTEYKDMGVRRSSLRFTEKLILEQLGIDAVVPDDGLLEEILGKFGETFPVTKIFSAYARSRKSGDPVSDPDNALVTWISKEEELFRALEKHIVSKRLEEGFGRDNRDVDAFIDFSLSVHNRRKARMGKSLENHLAFIFEKNALRFSAGKTTEQKKKPDFIFPGVDEYHNSRFPVSRLTMLGAKSTCKDRWRQVCSEAARIPLKHLITLEPGITVFQTAEMSAAQIQLVVPSEIQKSYNAQQQKELLNIGNFISLVKKRQR